MVEDGVEEVKRMKPSWSRASLAGCVFWACIGQKRWRAMISHLWNAYRVCLIWWTLMSIFYVGWCQVVKARVVQVTTASSSWSLHAKYCCEVESMHMWSRAGGSLGSNFTWEELCREWLTPLPLCMHRLL